MLEIKKTRTVTTTETLDLNQKHWWRVSTEGDVEGRTIRQLGVHHGTFLEVAKALSSSCSYVLDFELLNPNDVPDTAPRKEVAVTLRNVPSESLAKELRKLGVVSVCHSNGVTISLKN